MWDNKFLWNVNVFSLLIWLQYLEEQIPKTDIDYCPQCQGYGWWESLPVWHGLIGSGWIIRWNAIFDCNVVEHIASIDNVANLKRKLYILLHSRNGFWRNVISEANLARLVLQCASCPRQAQRPFSRPMVRSTVVLVCAWAWLYLDSCWFEGFVRGVNSHVFNG